MGEASTVSSGRKSHTVDKEPKWRRRGRELTTGYHPTTYSNGGQQSTTRQRAHT